MRTCGAFVILVTFGLTDGGPGVASAQVTRTRLPGLSGPVQVRYDSRAVPHIWASTEPDAYRALGYVVARDRLAQLELQVRSLDGTLTGLMGSGALQTDRRQRSLGLAASADSAWERLAPDSPERRILEAYSDGVNAWISGLPPERYPIEYQTLNARPAEWKPRYGLYILKQMGQTLTLVPDNLQGQRRADALGAALAEALFPAAAPIQQPVVASDTGYPDLIAFPIPPPPAASGMRPGPDPRSHDRPGSNAWAVAPSRTLRGHALLAGDPHLDLTLPSIWYEAHLMAPGLDVYGVTIPGAPVVAMGFNADVAWAFTNSQADVLDYYREVVDDPGRPSQSLLAGEWVPVTSRIEVYRDPEGVVLAVDTFYSSHRGTMIRIDDTWYSRRWTVTEAGGTLSAFMGFAHAGTVAEWIEAGRVLSAPPLTGVVADREGSIAVKVVGRLPRRTAASGMMVQDGTRNAGWAGDVPYEELPVSVDPDRGYVATANQQPTDPRGDGTYYGNNWPGPWRAIRLNKLLESGDAFTADDMRLFQTDPESARVGWFLPWLLHAGEGRSSADSGSGVARRLLAEWDGRYTIANERAILFEMVMDALSRMVWDELRSAGVRATPSLAVMARLLEQPESPWWDDRSTAEVEDRDALLARALAAGHAAAVKAYGPAQAGGWRWGDVRPLNIPSLSGIPSLAARAAPLHGGPGTLGPVTGEQFGASWRMVVELDSPMRAWTIYPGGQSGDPRSPWYRNMIPEWSAGRLEAVILPRGPEELERGVDLVP